MDKWVYESPKDKPRKYVTGYLASHDFVLKNHLLLMFERYIYLNKDNKNGLNISGLSIYQVDQKYSAIHSSGER